MSVSRPRLNRLVLLLMSAWFPLGHLPSFGAAGRPDSAPQFCLQQRGAGREVCLTNLAGKIVVLDFFAHWCVPCLRCSAEIESGIRNWYGRGNPQHVPVEVLAVNIESARPDRTEAFIKRAGLGIVVDDPVGEVFRQYGGEGMPFIVIIDARGMTVDKPARIVYREAGFQAGVAPLRQVIDQLLAPAVAPAPPPEVVATARVKPAPVTLVSPSRTQTPVQTNRPRAELQPQPASAPAEAQLDRALSLSIPPSHVPTVWLSDLDFTCLWANDVLLTDETIELRQIHGDFETGLALTHAHIGLDYVPESLLEHPAELASERFGFQVQAKAQATRRVRLLAGGGAYYGYMDYRTFWLNEHFEQLYSRRPGYEKAHPWGYNASGGCRWEYLPASGFVQGDLVWQQDVIAPGYEVALTFPPRLVRFRDTYDTLSGRATFENVLTPWLRAQQIVQVIDTSERQLRLALESDANFALAESWVLRLSLAGAREEPQFESWSVGVTLEHDWNETWFLSLICRYYHDTGEIENALLPENTAGPPLKAFQAGVGLRWQRGSNSFKLVLGPYFTRYEQVGSALSTFQHLYQNRDWFSAQLAFAHEF